MMIIELEDATSAFQHMLNIVMPFAALGQKDKEQLQLIYRDIVLSFAIGEEYDIPPQEYIDIDPQGGEDICQQQSDMDTSSTQMT